MSPALSPFPPTSLAHKDPHHTHTHTQTDTSSVSSPPPLLTNISHWPAGSETLCALTYTYLCAYGFRVALCLTLFQRQSDFLCPHGVKVNHGGAGMRIGVFFAKCVGDCWASFATVLLRGRKCYGFLCSVVIRGVGVSIYSLDWTRKRNGTLPNFAPDAPSLGYVRICPHLAMRC